MGIDEAVNISGCEIGVWPKRNVALSLGVFDGHKWTLTACHKTFEIGAGL